MGLTMCGLASLQVAQGLLAVSMGVHFHHPLNAGIAQFHPFSSWKEVCLLKKKGKDRGLQCIQKVVDTCHRSLDLLRAS